MKKKLFMEAVTPITKYLFSRNSYVGPIWIFIIDTDQT